MWDKLEGDNALNWLQVVLLSVVQGLTEFLPISSSGHLALLENLLGWNANPQLKSLIVPFNTLLHFGTLSAVIAYFRHDIWNMLRLTPAHATDSEQTCASAHTLKDKDSPAHHQLASRTWLLFILVANVPTGIIGILLEKATEEASISLYAVAISLIITGVLLITAEWLSSRCTSDRPLTLFKALLIGCAQGIAVMPGLSRSGATISAGLALGLSRDTAARFAFLISIPAILAATFYEGRKLLAGIPGTPMQVIVACVLAGVVGYLAIGIVMRAVRKGKLKWFALYCFIIAMVIIAGTFFHQ